MVEIRCNRKCTEIILGVTKVKNHGCPGACHGVNDSFPGTEILLQDWLSRKDDISHVNHLLLGHRRVGVSGKGREIFDGVEDQVNWLRDVEVKVLDFDFCGTN